MLRILLVAILALASGQAMAACGDPGEEQPDAGPAEPVAQGSEATTDLVVNELSPADDWVELLNRTDAPIDLAGYYLTDKADRLDHYVLLEGELLPGEHVVVEPDAFGLARSDELNLLTTTGLPVDGLAYLYVGAKAGESLARQPSGQGRFYFAPATPGESN